MKKTIFLFFFSTLFCGSLFAQPQLQMNVVPEIGDVVTFYEADTLGVTQGNAGANQTWNFSNLQPLSDVDPVQYFYLAPASTPPQFASKFPTANFAIRIGPASDTAGYAYSIKSANQWEFLGIKNDLIEQVYPNTDIQLKNLSYNGSFTDDFTNYTDAGTGFIFYGKGTRTITYDAYGTLQTPAGTFSNAMRLKGVSTQVDSVNFGVGEIINHTTLTVYDWVVANQPGVLVSVYYTRIISEYRYPGLDTLFEDTGVFKSVNYIDNLSVGTFERPDELAGVTLGFAGANPATNQLDLKITTEKSQDLRLMLTNIEGKVLSSQSLTLAAGENQVSLPVGHLPAGAYFATLTDGRALRTLTWQKH